MFAAVDLAAECRALECASAKIKRKRHQRIELTVGERHGDQAQHCALGGLYISNENGECLLLSDWFGEILVFFDHMSIPYGEISGRA